MSVFGIRENKCLEEVVPLLEYKSLVANYKSDMNSLKDRVKRLEDLIQDLHEIKIPTDGDIY